MSDKELLFQAANTFTKNLVGNLFGIPIKFGEADIDEFEKRFKTLKANNGQH